MVARAVLRSGEARPTSFVYFLLNPADGRVKIGRAKNVGARVADLQTGHSQRLRLLAVVVGGRPVERAYQRRFAKDREGGEWFRPSAELMACIDELNREVG